MWFLHGWELYSGHVCLLQCGDSPWAAEACLTMVFCRAISALVAGAPPPIPSLECFFPSLLFPALSPSGILSFLRCVSLRHQHSCAQGVWPHSARVGWDCPCLHSTGLSSQSLPHSQRLTSDTLGAVGWLKNYQNLSNY